MDRLSTASLASSNSETKSNTSFDINSIEGLTIGECISKSCFSKVFSGTYNNQKVAIKMIDKAHIRRAAAEIAILKEMSDSKHITRLIKVFDENCIIAIFEYIEPVSEQYFFDHLSFPRLRFILRSLLITVTNLKNHRIAHRDIKFSNMLITRHFSDMKLCGFGSGSFVFKRMSPTAGARRCRPPEMLLGYRMYRYQGDCWAIGMFILWILSEGNIPFTMNKNSEESLISISKFFGSDPLLKLMDDYNLHPSDVDTSKFSSEKLISFEDLFTPRMKAIANEEVVSLMKGFLTIDPEKRLTTEAALKRKLFSRV